jgi:hypothetical protein
MRVLPTDQIEPDLTQTEEVEVVDQERRQQHQPPAEGEQTVEHGVADGLFNAPDDDADGLPVSEHCD